LLRPDCFGEAGRNPLRILGFSVLATLISAICELCMGTYLLTYLLTPWSRVLLEKLTGFAASQEIPRICMGTKFIKLAIKENKLNGYITTLHKVNKILDLSLQ
jgi:hypothetical protein